MEEVPDDLSNAVMGAWSSYLTDAYGSTTYQLTLTFVFGSPHKSKGITLYFHPHTNDYARSASVTWLNASNATIKEGTYTLSGNIGVIEESVADYKSVVVKLIGTNNPFRWIKLYGIDFGIARTFVDSEIDTCKIYENVNMLSDEITANTLRFTIKTKDPVFSPVSGDIGDDMLLKKQYLHVSKNNERFGTFFLTDWEDIGQTGAHFRFSAEDAMSVLEKYTFDGGIYNNQLASDLLDSIFLIAFPTGLIRYRLEDNLLSSKVSGWLPVCSCREAFQQICFAIGAVASTARLGTVQIFSRRTTITQYVPLSRQYIGGKYKPMPYYSGVDVVSYAYTAASESVEAHNGALGVGEYRIEFSQPLHSLSISGGAIMTAHVNYAKIKVAAAGTVLLSGKRYTENRLTATIREPIATGEVESIATFDGCKIVSAQAAAILAPMIMQYLKNRMNIETDIILQSLKTGDVASFGTKGRDIIGGVERLDINLRASTAKAGAAGNVDTAGHR